MRRSQLFVGVALGIACTGIALSGSAQQKKPKHGATPAASSTAAPPAASGPAHAAPHGKPGHTPDPKPKPVVDEPKPPPPDTSPGATGHQVVERESHIEFDERMLLWRGRHVRMVERMIGMKAGTGGSLGVRYLQTTLEKRFFPELWAVRTELGARGPLASDPAAD